MNKLKNPVVGNITVSDILKEIKSCCHYNADYQSDRDSMIGKINFYLKLLGEEDE